MQSTVSIAPAPASASSCFASSMPTCSIVSSSPPTTTRRPLPAAVSDPDGALV
jgi:hypothetical protein